MSNYCRIAEVYTDNETIRIIKVDQSVIVNEGDLVRLTDGAYGEVITVAFLDVNEPEYRIIDHIKPIEDYRDIYHLHHHRSEEADHADP